MTAVRIVAALLLVVGLTVFAARPALSGRVASGGSFLHQPEERAAVAAFDESDRQPDVAIHPGRWVSLGRVGEMRAHQAIDFSADGRFALEYVVGGDAKRIDDTAAGTYTIRGRTLTFAMDANGRRVTRRMRVKELDAVHMLLLTAGGTPVAMTRIFDADSAIAYAR